jgi:hypothetical protein
MLAVDDKAVARQNGPLVFTAFSVALLAMILVVAAGANRVVELPASRWLNSHLKMTPSDACGRRLLLLR